MYTSLKRPEAARVEYTRTAELYQQALPHDIDGRFLNAYAWFLVDCPDATLRDPARAVRLAERAVARNSAQTAYWHTLGVACYRAGDWAASREALERARKLSDGGGPWIWFFLAMAQRRQGEWAMARVWYDKAIRWMDEHTGPDESLLRYRAEADALFAK
jgi:tetratricopeptide (TPR) repeat protein